MNTIQNVNNSYNQRNSAVYDVMDFSSVVFQRGTIKNLLNSEGLGLNPASVSEYSSEGYKETLKTEDGKTYIFNNKNLSEYKSDNCYVNFNGDGSNLNDMCNTGNNTLDYTASISVNDSSVTNFYSVGNDNYNTKQMAINFAEAYKNYSPNTLNYLSSNNFGGIVCSQANLSMIANIGNNNGAYAAMGKNGQFYIYIPVGEKYDFNKKYYKINTVNHETGHILENIIPGFNKEVTHYLYNKYKNILPSLSESCYGSASKIKISESPNESEFFADSITNYFASPIELKRYMPDMYEYIDGVLK